MNSNVSSLPPAKQVWVIDDDETVLILAEEVLRSEGFEVACFSDAEAALSQLQQSKPDIIVLDLLMPGMDGFGFCARLRADPAISDIPVLMATSLDDPGSINRAYEAGATDFAAKPLNWAIEVHRLRYMLRAADTANLLKATELETRRARDDWERTFNSFSDVVTLIGPDMTIIRANSATLAALNKPMEAIIGSKCYTLFEDANSPCANCPIREAMERREVVSAERFYSNPAANYLLTGSPVTDDKGSLLHVVHIAHDITDQKQLEMEYRHAQKMEAMGTLAGGIAHDFNNLLAVVSGYSELIKDDPESSEQLKEYAETVYQAAQRGASLARQLLTFSRKGASQSEKKPLRCDEMVKEVQKMLARVLPKSVVIETHFEDGLAQIKASVDQLHQVLMNLAVNAAHAMPDGGTLTIETRNTRLSSDYCRLHPQLHPGDYVLLAVTDTGHGMDHKTMERIFEPFFTTKKIGEGTGLGLSVVYGIVKDHGGAVLCYSEVGLGTSFRIYLPAILHEQGTQDVRVARSGIRGGKEAILVVDDESHLRNLLKRALTKYGYTVVAAADGESALLRYEEEKHRLSLVLLDLDMPGMGGWECLKQLRAVAPGLPVLITTGYGGGNLAGRAELEGAVGLLPKPYQVEDLFKKIREILQQQSFRPGQ
jgi:signal transduction histidine kinase